MFNEYMWQRFYLTGKVDDYLVFRESDESGPSDEDEADRPLITL